ncbi:MAG: Gfo/Idh/MocA family oxidoreductase [Actinomycetota bacterium]
MRGALVGAGYFARFHLDAWDRVDGAELVTVIDPDRSRASQAAGPRRLNSHASLAEAIADPECAIDFVDIVTPPETHHRLAVTAAAAGLHVICQKPLAPTLAEAEALVAEMGRRRVRFMVHENWRWQPWYRAIARLVDSGRAGEPHHASFVMRSGDGWGANAYLDRQPYFRHYPRLLFHETGIHFVDTFRFLLGEVISAYAVTARRNPVIAGEDAGVAVLRFASGATATFDGSRYHESDAAEPRYTFGRFRLDASAGHAELDLDGVVRWTPLGGSSEVVLADPPRAGFGGDAVLTLQQHFVDGVASGEAFESEGDDYLRTMRVVEACYRSADTGEVVHLDEVT